MVCNGAFQGSLDSDSSFSFLTIHLKLDTMQSKHIELITLSQVSLNLSLCVRAHVCFICLAYFSHPSRTVTHYF